MYNKNIYVYRQKEPVSEKNKMRKIILITLIIFAGLFSMEGFVVAETKKALPLLPVKSVPETTPAVEPQTVLQGSLAVGSSYSYNPVGKPDPFRPFVEEESAAKKKDTKKDLRSIFPLQRFDIDKFRVVGIAGDKNRRVAVVEDAVKKYYPLFIGTHIGTNRGKVVEILPDRVIVEEYETKKAKRIILKLHKNSNEVKP